MVEVAAVVGDESGGEKNEECERMLSPVCVCVCDGTRIASEGCSQLPRIPQKDRPISQVDGEGRATAEHRAHEMRVRKQQQQQLGRQEDLMCPLPS